MINHELTPREREILALVAQGMSNQEIADRLTIVERTVRTHMTAVMGKLYAANRTHAVAIAREQGLLERTRIVEGDR